MSWINEKFAQNSAKERLILKYYVDRLKEEESFNSLQKAGFLDLISKCAVRDNASFDQFSADIERESAAQKYRKKSEKYEALASLKRDWRRELKVIRKCIDCYVLWTEKDEDKDYFTFVCTKPHLLVFVEDAKESSLWPAKVMCLNNDGITVSVECFGDHLQAEYPFEKCYLYSDAHIIALNKSALGNAKFPMQKKYNRSFQEVKKYIENIEKKFGRFVPAPAIATISDFDLHMSDMYPGFSEQTSTGDVLKNSPLGASTVINNCTNGAMKRMNSPDPQSSGTASVSQGTSASDFGASSRAVSIKSEELHNIELDSTHNDSKKHKIADGLDIGNSSQSNDDVIVIDEEEDPDVTEIMKNSSQNPSEQSVSGRSRQAMLDEFCDITRKIYQIETRLNHLKEQEGVIRAKFNQPEIGNVDGILDELTEVTKKSLECEEQLGRQKDEEGAIIAKIKSCK